MKNINFEKNNYSVIKNAITKEMANFIYHYFLLKRLVAKTLFDTNFISPFTDYFGTWKDEQVLDTYSHYSDIVMETLLVELLPIMEKETGLKLNPNYSYARIYKKGDILKRHKDRFSCEISTTLNLGGDKWPIYLNLNQKEGIYDGKIYKASKSKGIKIILNPGDMLIYKGNILEHWRESFEGENCAQVFLHYNDKNTEGSDKNIFDKRPHLGLPSNFKK
jgi:hypothetical protein